MQNEVSCLLIIFLVLSNIDVKSAKGLGPLFIKCNVQNSLRLLWLIMNATKEVTYDSRPDMSLQSSVFIWGDHELLT